MWNIAICESDELFVEQLKTVIEEFYDNHELDLDLKIYHSGAEFEQHMDEPVHLAFFNTRPDGKRDYSLISRIRNANPEMQVIFLSDYDEDVFEATRHLPYRYIRKRFWREELDEALRAYWRHTHQGRVLIIRQKGRTKAVPLDNVIYMESVGHYVVIHCTNQVYRTREKLSNIAAKTADLYFMSIAKSYLVNCAYVSNFDQAVFLTNGMVLNCSQSQYKNAIAFHKRYIHEMFDKG